MGQRETKRGNANGCTQSGTTMSRYLWNCNAQSEHDPLPALCPWLRTGTYCTDDVVLKRRNGRNATSQRCAWRLNGWTQSGATTPGYLWNLSTHAGLDLHHLLLYPKCTMVYASANDECLKYGENSMRGSGAWRLNGPTQSGVTIRWYLWNRSTHAGLDLHHLYITFCCAPNTLRQVTTNA